MFEKTVEIPNGVNASMNGNRLIVTGPKGQLERVFYNHIVKMEVKDGVLRISSSEDRRKSKAIAGTWVAVSEDMMIGVKSEWEAKLKAVYSHFPMKLGVDGQKFVIQNFLGEKAPRKAKIIPGTKVKVEKEIVTITGVNREKVGQTAGNIEIAAKITGYDRRVFQDGIFITQSTTEVGKHE
jgi:large subunit ribosomal protein L6